MRFFTPARATGARSAADGERVLHRLLFRPGVECELRFRARALRLLPRGAAGPPGHVERFVDGPVSAP